MAAFLALACAAVYGGADFLGGLASRRADPRAVALVATLVATVATALLVAVVGGSFGPATIGYGAIGGLCGTIGLVMFFRGLATGAFQVVSPIASVTSAAVPVSVGLLRGEQPGSLAAFGLAIALPSIWLLSGGTTRAPEGLAARPVAQALAAGLGFGTFFVFLAETPEGSGPVPLLAAKGAGLVALWLIALAVPTGPVPTDAKPAASVSGILDVSANGLFLAASRLGDLSVVGALAALFPASNALLARIVLGERITRVQGVGFAGALGAGVLLSA